MLVVDVARLPAQFGHPATSRADVALTVTDVIFAVLAGRLTTPRRVETSPRHISSEEPSPQVTKRRGAWRSCGFTSWTIGL